ncbi:MAG: hypothetical protein WD295_01005, partial [Bacteroidota bacterium]
MKLSLFPRQGATADAFVGEPGPRSSFLLNPAGLGDMDQADLSFSHTQWIQDTRSQVVALRVPFDGGSAAAFVATTSVGEIEIRTQPGPAAGTFTARTVVIGTAIAGSIVSGVSGGMTVKYLYDKVYIDEATGYAVDAGLLYRTPVAGLTAGAAVTNVGTMSAYR